MLQNKLPVVYQMRPDPANEDDNIYDAEVIDSRPHRAETRTTAPQPGYEFKPLLKFLIRLALGPFVSAISGFWQPSIRPTYPDHEPPYGPAGGSPKTPGHSSGAQESAGYGDNRRGFWFDDGAFLAGKKSDENYWYVILVGRPEFIKRLLAVLAGILLLIALGLITIIPELGLGNVLDVIFAFAR